jgi:hypothetical protein
MTNIFRPLILQDKQGIVKQLMGQKMPHGGKKSRLSGVCDRDKEIYSLLFRANIAWYEFCFELKAYYAHHALTEEKNR